MPASENPAPPVVRPIPRATWARRLSSAARKAPHGAALLVVLTFVFFMGLLPHTDTFSDPAGPPSWSSFVRASWEYASGEREGYPYTIHVDENVHWVRAASLQRQEKVLLDDPYTGAKRDPSEQFSLRGAIHEVGFHAILAEIQWFTGVPFLHLFHFLPAAWMAFTAFALYALLRPHPAALPAAAFVALIPTTPRFLGPAIVVPIGFVLAWIPVVLILAGRARTNPRSALLLGLAVVWAFFVHLIGGFAAVLVLAVYAVAGATRDRRGLLALLVVAFVPLLWLANSFFADVQGEAAKEEILPIDFGIFRNYGVFGFAAFAAGVVLLEWLPPRRMSAEFRALAESAVLMLGLIIISVTADLNRYATYARWHPPMFLAASAALGFAVWSAGQGFRAIVWGSTARSRGSLVPTIIQSSVALVVAVLLLAPGVAAHQDEAYYHTLSDSDWDQFRVAAAAAGPEYEVFVAHPWKAPVFAALTGKYPWTWLNPGSPPVRGEDYGRVAAGAADNAFFLSNDVTLVIGAAPGVDLFEPAGPGVWLMKEDLARQVFAIRQTTAGP